MFARSADGSAAARRLCVHSRNFKLAEVLVQFQEKLQKSV
jgi:hypothetical protein